MSSRFHSVLSLPSDIFGDLSVSVDSITEKRYLQRTLRPSFRIPSFETDLIKSVCLKHPGIKFPHKLSLQTFANGTVLFSFTHGNAYSDPSSPLAKMKLLFGIAESLRFLHSHDIFHPISPETILLVSEGEPVIVNPGWLKYLSAEERIELVDSAIEWSQESDVFAFGSFAFRVLTGRPSGRADVLTFEEDTPQPFAELIAACRHRKGSQRPSFDVIVRQFITGDLVLPGVSVPEFRGYVGRVLAPEFAAHLLFQLLGRGRRLSLVEVGRAEVKALNAPTEREGLFQRLNRENHGNVHELGIVQIEGNHYDDEERFKVGGILEQGWRDHWESKNEPNSFVRFDFTGTGGKIQLYKYEIQTWNNKTGHMVQWVVEGSDDASIWTELDRRAAITQLCHPSNRCCFNCTDRDKQFWFIRIRQTGLNSGGMNILNLSGIEFYGDLVEEE
jgi:hypothetical protein